MKSLVKLFESIIHEGACCDYDTCCHRRDYHVWHVADLAMFHSQSGNQFRGICEDCGSSEMRSGALWQQLKEHEQDSGDQPMLIREYDMDDVEDQAWTSDPRTRNLSHALAEMKRERDDIQATLTSVEHEVALVYCEITGGAISKCNTDAAVVISVAHDCFEKSLQEEIQRRAIGSHVK